MIKEISNFVEKIDEKYFTEGLTPSDGLHIWIKLDNKGNKLETKCYRVKTLNKNKKIFDVNLDECIYPQELLLREFYSGLISTNKSLDSPAKKIHSSSPFVIWFKKKSISSILDLIDTYYKNTKKYFDETQHYLIEVVKNYLAKNLESIFKSINELFDETKDDEYIKIYFDSDINLVKKGYMNYLGSNLFNKDNYNTEDNKHGLSGFLNADNVKKIFVMHKTTNYIVNNRITRNDAYHLHLFQKLVDNKPIPKLPNPLPVFIDHDEIFNQRVIELYNRDGILIFNQIIRKLIDEYKRDLSNYYLIFWSRIGGLTIYDFDFVPLFRFNIEDFYLKNYFLKDVSDIKISNVFDFELKIVQPIFSNVLIQFSKQDKKTSERKISYRYFDDIEYNSKFMTKTTHINVLKYRKSFYDFIYKSKLNAINSRLFHDLMITTIVDDIKHHNNKNGYNATDYNIREKLNIYFSLNKNFGGDDMGSKIQPLQEKLKKLLTELDVHIELDEEFAFDAGQLVYYILYQSEASNKTHALIEPYITKNDIELFKVTIARGIDQYKHKLPFGTKKFQKLASEVLAWESKTKIKDMMPLFLAGYFSNSLLFESSK